MVEIMNCTVKGNSGFHCTHLSVGGKCRLVLSVCPNGLCPLVQYQDRCTLCDSKCNVRKRMNIAVG